MKYSILLFLALGFLVRLLAFLFIDYMFVNDVHTFQAWGIQLASNGLGGFYTSGMWSDYPPGFLYVLALLGTFRNLFEWDVLSPIFNFFTFLPAMLADLAIGYVIFRQTRNYWVTALWVFNPAIILISSIWGQVESVFLLPLFISLILVREKKLLLGYILYGVAILIKPQSLFLGAVYLFSAFDYWREKGFVWAELKRIGLYISAAIAGMLLLAFPFTRGFNFLPVFRQYFGSLDSYNFGSINAFNLWALLGRNWQTLDAEFLGLTHATWGVVIAAVIIIITFLALEINKRKNSDGYWLIVAAVFVLTFVFSVKMHERYLFPAILFLLLYASEKPRWYTVGLFVAVCTTFYFNCIAVLQTFHSGWDYTVLERYIVPVSWANIGIAYGLVLTCGWGLYKCLKK
jgi:Gpi18-like mannosyltransferase